MAELVGDVVTTSDDNVAFGRVVQEWLARHGVSDCEGIVLVVMRPDGFELLQIGDRLMSTSEVMRYMAWVGRQVEGVA